jgi:hypothetical protein
VLNPLATAMTQPATMMPIGSQVRTSLTRPPAGRPR